MLPPRPAAAAERDGGDRRAARFELLPDDRRSRARIDRGGAAPRGCAMPRARTGVRQDSPGMALHVGHGRARHPRATWSAVGCVSSAARSGPGSARPARPGRSGTTPRATARDRSSRPLAGSLAGRCSSGQGASGGPGGPPPPARRGPVSALEIRKTNGGEQRVHSASTRSTTTANRPPQPYTPYCGCLQGFSARPRASVNARNTLTLPW